MARRALSKAKPRKLAREKSAGAKRPFDIDLVIERIRGAVKPFAKAMLFEIYEDGHTSAFEQLVACIISIRTRDETSLVAVRRLFAVARTPEQMSALSPGEIDDLIHACTFHEPKAATIHAIAERVVAEFGGEWLERHFRKEESTRASYEAYLRLHVYPHIGGMELRKVTGQALANLYAGIEEGARVIDSAAGGLGGCPYAPGATGNVATEDVVYMLEGMGIATGVDMARLVAATNQVSKLLGRPPVSRVASALNAKRRGANSK